MLYRKNIAPGSFHEFGSRTRRHYGKLGVKPFTDFVISEGFLRPNLFPIGQYVKAQYFWAPTWDDLPEDHPDKDFILYVSDFGFEALANLYYLKKIHG